MSSRKSIVRNIIFAILFFFVLFVIVPLFIPKSTSGKKYYDFAQYKKTIDSPVNGVIKEVYNTKDLHGARIGPDSISYSLEYFNEKTPKEWLQNYPYAFIKEGDTIHKKASNDTFVVIRNGYKWTYILPYDSLLKK